MEALLALAIALVPAAAAFVRGRRLARFADDPALPERLLAGRSVGSTWLAGAFTVLLMLTGRAAIWAIPFALVALAAARLPLRRILYGETWSLAVYLSFVVRFFIAFWGFWLLVCGVPALALWADGRAWAVSLTLGAGLLLLATRQIDVIRWLMGARPVADEAIRSRFDRLVTAAGLAAPHFEYVDLRGGSMANAIALSSLRGSAVVVTGPLLQRLDADETDAICAHELAHIEFYNPRRLRRIRLITLTLILGGALLAPLAQALVPGIAWLACIAWPSVVFIALLLMAHNRQQHETASDLRAIALTGNPEALVRALVKLHAIARVPRRWDADLERHHSHPSLKRRIQSIRGAAGTPPAALGDAAVFDSEDGAVRAVFGVEGIEWIEGTSASYRLAYDRLSDLRVFATRTNGTTILVAADRAGHRWQMPIRVDDVPRIQAVLDIVEARVQTIGPAPSIVQPLLIRAATFVVFVCMLNAGLIASALIAALTLARPEAPLIGAAGFAAVAAAVLTWRDSVSTFGILPDEYRMLFGAVLLAAGMALVWIAYTRRRDADPPRALKHVGVLAAAALASWILPIAGSGVDPLGLHQAARQWSSSVVLPLALTGALIWSARKTLRGVAAFAAIASVAAASAGSQAFLDRFGGDVFLVPVSNLNVRTLDRPVKEFTIPFGVSGLRLSPTGRSIAAIAPRQNQPLAIQIGRAGETLTPVDGNGVLFIDDDRVLVWKTDGSRTDLREVLAAAPQDVIWQISVTGLTMPAVSLDAKTNRWRLSSQAGTGAVEGREGVIGTDRIESHRWSLSASRGTPVMPIALSGDRALALEPRLDLSLPLDNPLSTLFYVFASAPRWRSTIWALGPDGPVDLGTSRLELECHLVPLADRGACQIFDSSRTRFFAMDAATRGITAIGALPGRFYVGEVPEGPWITGWHQTSPLAVRLAPADAIRVAGPNGSQPTLFAVSDHVAAGVWFEAAPASTLRVDPIGYGMATSTIRIYPID